MYVCACMDILVFKTRNNYSITCFSLEKTDLCSRPQSIEMYKARFGLRVLWTIWVLG